MITLDDGQGLVINLPRSLEWNDRFRSRVQQDKRFTIGGSFIVQESKIKAGNEVTLTSGENVFITYGVLKQLEIEYQKTGKTYLLTLPDGTTMDVIFNHPDPVQASPVLRCDTYGDNDYFNNLTIKFNRVDEAA